VVREQSRLRSVDSEWVGRVIEPRKNFTVAGADAFVTAEGSIGWAAVAWSGRSRRGRRAGHVHIGVPQEPGKPCRLHVQGRNGATGTANPRPTAGAARSGGSGERPDTKNSVAGVVPPSEGNEVRRDGRQGLGASRSTCEAGESPPWETLWRKGDAGSSNRWRETWQVHRDLVPCSRNDNG